MERFRIPYKKGDVITNGKNFYKIVALKKPNNLILRWEEYNLEFQSEISRTIKFGYKKQKKN